MAEDRRIVLIQSLHDRTQEKIISWERTAVPGVFQVAFLNYSVTIARRPTREEEALEDDVYIRIYDQFGDIIEEIVDTDLGSEGMRPTPYQVMDSIYTMARRSSLGVDKAINELIMQLTPPMHAGTQ